MKSLELSKPVSDLTFARWLVVINGGIPLALLGWDAFRGKLGANPISFAILTTGMMALIFLCLSLLVSPLRVLTGRSWLISFRRSLGLYAFFYALAHFTIFFVWDRELSVSSTVHEIRTRLYLIYGTVALVLMMPLAITSTNGMVKRLGAKRWQHLHKLVYISVIAGTVHFYLQAKSDKRLPTAFATTVAILLVYRYVKLWFEAAAMAPALKLVGQPGNPSAGIGPRPKFWTGQLRVARKFVETPTVQTFRLVAVDDRNLPFDFTAGQYLNLSLDVGGKKVNRSYTIASAPTRRGYCELTIKREETGVASRHLHDVLHQGDLLSVSAPAGRFTFNDKDSNSIVLIGAGVGITPLMSVIRDLTDRCWPGDIFLVYAAKTRADVIFEQELAILQKRFPNLHVTFTLSQHAEQSWSGGRGRITRELLNQAVPDLLSRLIHVCGPTEMMRSVTQVLHDIGVPGMMIRTEVFQSSGALAVGPQNASEPQPLPETESFSQPVVEENGGGAVITFARSGKTVTVSRSTTVLEAAEVAGVNIEFECRSGICGTCKTKLIAGSVFMGTRDALIPSDVFDNIILACQAKPREDVTVSA